jgi:hypothetical protein
LEICATAALDPLRLEGALAKYFALACRGGSCQMAAWTIKPLAAAPGCHHA